MRVIPPVSITSKGSFTRSTTGTCYNSIGLINTVAANLPRFNYNPLDLTQPPTLLIEAASTNLMLYSDAFDTAPWTKSGASITANNTMSPDGTTNADKLVESATNATHSVAQFSTNSSATFTCTVYVKAAERTKLLLSSYSSPANVGVNAVFDVGNKTTGTITSLSGGSATTSITGVGNSWYRLQVSTTAVASTYIVFTICLLDSSGNTTYIGDGTSGVFLYGAQVESGTKATSYIPTTSATVTRSADTYSGTGLIYTNVAESSVNLLSRTEDFGDTTYWTQDASSVTSNVANDPLNNYLTADSITKTGTKLGIAHIRQQVILGTGFNVGKTYTGSVYMWCASGTKSVNLVISDIDYNTYSSTAQTVTTTPTRFSFSTNGGGAWNASGNKMAFGLDLASLTNGDTIYVCDAQLEVGTSASAYVQSYIYENPWISGTTYPLGAVVTRNTNHRNYQKLTSAAGSSTAPESDTTNWFDLGPNNAWSMFATDRTVSTSNPNSIQVLISPGQRIDSIGIVGLDASRVDISVYTPNGVQYSYTENLNPRNTTTWKEYFLSEFAGARPTVIKFDLPPILNTLVSVIITKTGSTAKCSTIVMGTNVYLGSVQMNPKSEVLNFSKIDRDTYGNSNLTPRRSVPKTTQELFVTANQVNKIRATRTTLNAVPALWSGLDDSTSDNYYEALLILGIYKEFTIALENQINARISLQLEEL